MTNSKNAGRVTQGRMIRRYGAPAALETRLDPGDAQAAACGVINGLLLSLPLWGMAAAILWALS
jgi:hypothetical protein